MHKYTLKESEDDVVYHQLSLLCMSHDAERLSWTSEEFQKLVDMKVGDQITLVGAEYIIRTE